MSPPPPPPRKFGTRDLHLLGEVLRLGLNTKECVAQCYDGAAAIKGHLSDVHKKIWEKVGRGCVYHLNLVVVNTASGIKKVNDCLMEAVYREPRSQASPIFVLRFVFSIIHRSGRAFRFCVLY